MGTGKHLGFVLLAWAVFFLLAAWVLPPLDSHLQLTPPVYWSFVTLAALLALSTVIVVPAYVYRSWLRFPTVPNRTAYGLWVGLTSLLLLAVLGVAGWYFVGWSLNRAFQSATQEGGGLRKVVDVAEATVGSTWARGDVPLQPGKSTGEGGLAFYQKNPQALQRGKKYFETWHSALAIADAGRKSEHQLGRWESNTTATWIAQSQSTDAWGHAFCVQSDQRETIVVSPGPQALSSLDCNTLKVTGEELAQMPQGRL